MDLRKCTFLPEIQQLADVLDDALNLVDSKLSENAMPELADDIQPSLFEQCIELCRQCVTPEVESIRTIHHLSCTGGTLITKCLAAMPNVMVLNEVDPLSNRTFNPNKPAFTPTDIISLVRQGYRNASDNLLIKLFLQSLNLLYNELRLTGKRLLLRDHSHSHFLTDSENITSRPSLGSILNEHFKINSILTVRDPVESFLSLQQNGWQHFKPNTFDEYCLRYHKFLDAYENIPIFRYEDFVCDPKIVMIKMCTILDFPYVESFKDTFDIFKFSGDSGRKGYKIEPRAKKKIDDYFMKNLNNEKYLYLIDRLGYS